MIDRWMTIAFLNALAGFAVGYGLTYSLQQALAVAALLSILLRIAAALAARAPAFTARTARSPRRRPPPARPVRFAEA